MVIPLAWGSRAAYFCLAMFPARRVVATALAICGLLSVPAVAQVAIPTSDVGQAARASVSTVSSPATSRLTVNRASGLLTRTLKRDRYKILSITGCRHSSSRVVTCVVDVMLDDAHFKGDGAVRLLRSGGARIRYSLLGVS